MNNPHHAVLTDLLLQFYLAHDLKFFGPDPNAKEVADWYAGDFLSSSKSLIIIPYDQISKPLGLLVANQHDDVGYINLVLSKTRGTGTMLVTKAERIFREMGLERVRTSVYRKNFAAICFFEKMGYERGNPDFGPYHVFKKII